MSVSLRASFVEGQNISGSESLRISTTEGQYQSGSESFICIAEIQYPKDQYQWVSINKLRIIQVNYHTGSISLRVSIILGEYHIGSISFRVNIVHDQNNSGTVSLRVPITPRLASFRVSIYLGSV